MLQRFEGLPEGLLETAPAELAGLLGGPALIHLDGVRRPPLFVSCLLHGNEPSGFLAVQELLRRQQKLPRALTLFIGNVEAAVHGARRLEGQPDFNRVWPGGGAAGPEAEMMAEVTEQMRRAGCFASIDLHNNTGANPLYGVVNRRAPEHLHLALLFARTLVYFTDPKGAQGLTFSEFCPAMTAECGRPGEPAGVAQAVRLLDAALHLDHLPARPPAPGDYDLLRTMARVKVGEGVDFDFGDHDTELSLPLTLETWNFHELPAGTAFARTRRQDAGLVVEEDGQTGAFDRYFERDGAVIRLKRPVIPAMLTKDPRIVRQDCLCYFMERIAGEPRV